MIKLSLFFPTDCKAEASVWRCALYTVALASFALLAGCGSLTGIPGHGGGKRFAVEQELVAAATRGALKQIDLSALKGKKVNLLVSAIGDTGAGNLLGGRFSLISQLRGDYIQSPVTTESSVFPHYTETTTTQSTTGGNSTTQSSGSESTSSATSSSTSANSQESGSSSTDSSSSSTTGATSTNGTGASDTSSSSTGSSTSNGNSYTSGSGSSSNVSNTSSSSSTSAVSSTDTMLPTPELKETQQKGGQVVAQFGAKYEGIGAYQNSEELSSNDLQYLSALLQTYLFLSGVIIVPPSEAEIDVYVTVDVFGTIRTRVEWFLANNEILRAKTSFEVLAVDHLTGRVVMAPKTAGSEAEYNEQYILWAGPVIIKKTLNISEPLLSDFSDVLTEHDPAKPVVQNVQIPYPFSHEIEKMSAEE